MMQAEDTVRCLRLGSARTKNVVMKAQVSTIGKGVDVVSSARLFLLEATRKSRTAVASGEYKVDVYRNLTSVREIQYSICKITTDEIIGRILSTFVNYIFKQTDAEV